MAPRSALLILGIQNEFLDPEAGRCVVTAPEPGKSSFVDTIKTFVSHFRSRGGDVIWVRSEYQKPRDFIDPRNDETVLIISDDSDSDSEADCNEGEKASRKGRKLKVVKGARPPLRTDAFLAVESDHPPCAPATTASEFHSSIQASITSPPDRVIVKTWFSAFKETSLLQTLRGRFISDLYVCGVITNVCILATAADAAKHGFNVYVMPDCLGYRSFLAHQQSLRVMADDYGVEEVRSSLLVKSWEREMQKNKMKMKETKDESSKCPQLGAISLSKEELVKMVTGIKQGETVVGDGKAPEKPGLGVATKAKEGSKGVSITQSPNNAASPEDIVVAVDPLYATFEGKSGLVSKQAGVERKAMNEEGDADMREVKDVERAKKERNEKQADEAVEAQGNGGKGKAGKETNPKGLKKKKLQGTKFDSKAPIMGEGDILGEGDSKLVNNILPKFLAKIAFDKLKNEIAWRTMYHRGGEVPRMVAVEGEINEDGSFPVYRHPADESPPLLQFSPTISLIREFVQKEIQHPVNHVLIQHYRDGNDYISEHSDKTLDIVRGSFIVNVSLGAQRTMILRTKKDAAREKAAGTSTRDKSQATGPERVVQRIPLPHNSMFVLGLESNKKWLHGIRQDRRESFLKKPEEMANNGERISLTFRHIGTFLSADEQKIYGQGAVSKSKDDPHAVINGNHPDTERLIEAFGSENQQSDFDWDASYGAGFDVLHLVPQLPKLFFAVDDVHSNRVRICLAEKGIEFKSHELQPNEVNTPSFRALNPRGTAPVLVDVDREKTKVYESLAILQYLEMSYPSNDPEKFLLPHPTHERAAFGLVLQRMQESERLASILEYGTKEEKQDELGIWNSYLARSPRYIMGNEISLADIAVWPVVEKFVRRSGWKLEGYTALSVWRITMAARDSTRRLVEDKQQQQEEEKSEEALEDKLAKLKVKEEKKELLQESSAKLEMEGSEGCEVAKEG